MSNLPYRERILHEKNGINDIACGLNLCKMKSARKSETSMVLRAINTVKDSALHENPQVLCSACKCGLYNARKRLSVESCVQNHEYSARNCAKMTFCVQFTTLRMLICTGMSDFIYLRAIYEYGLSIINFY